jgi:hypothetical protein
VADRHTYRPRERHRLIPGGTFAECATGRMERPDRGNTHFPFSDLNNLRIADLLSDYLKRKKLDTR